eukprot:GEMP01018330.1.p1 GENE.GEMP01018330.1~~GEMP01018330.1.p1  ORF type:complete len:461 (+),score=75.42 GEMP01018330.1:53-1435(+)
MATALVKEAVALPSAHSFYAERINDAIREAHALRIMHLHQSIGVYTKAQNLAIQLKVLSTWRHWVLVSRTRHQQRTRKNLPGALFNWQQRSTIRTMKREVFLAWHLFEKSERAVRRYRASGLSRLAARLPVHVKTRAFVSWKLVTRPAQQPFANTNTASTQHGHYFPTSSFRPIPPYGSTEHTAAPRRSEQGYLSPDRRRPGDDYADNFDNMVPYQSSPTGPRPCERRAVQRRTELSSSDDGVRDLAATSPMTQPTSFVWPKQPKHPTQRPEHVTMLRGSSSSSSSGFNKCASNRDYDLASSNSTSLLAGFDGLKQSNHPSHLVDTRNWPGSAQMFEMPAAHAAHPIVRAARTGSLDAEYARVGAHSNAGASSVAQHNAYKLSNYIVLRPPHRALSQLIVHYPPSPSALQSSAQKASLCLGQLDSTQIYLHKQHQIHYKRERGMLLMVLLKWKERVVESV